jgi:hypothetical protein
LNSAVRPRQSVNAMTVNSAPIDATAAAVRRALIVRSTTAGRSFVSDTSSASVARKTTNATTTKPSLPDSGVSRPNSSRVVEIALTPAPTVTMRSSRDMRPTVRRASGAVPGAGRAGTTVARSPG